MKKSKDELCAATGTVNGKRLRCTHGAGHGGAWHEQYEGASHDTKTASSVFFKADPA